jgi:hypothetical protein
MSLLSDIQLQVDESQGPVFWTIEQLYDAANAAQLEVWLNLKDWQRTVYTLNIPANADLVVLPESAIMIPQFIIYNGVKIFPTTTAQLQDWATNWKSQDKTRPNWYVLWDAQHIRLFPNSDANYTFQLWGVPLPTEIDDNNHDILNVDPLVKRAVTMRAASKLLEETQPQLADAKALEAEEFEKQYARQQRNTFGDNIMRLRPTTAWDQANFGDIKVGRLFMGTST